MANADPMLEVYIYENSQLLEQLEEMLLAGEKSASLGDTQIDEVFRIMHTIKGSSAMMGFDTLAALAHGMEDMFSHIREQRPRTSDWGRIVDLLLMASDYFKVEIAKIQEGKDPDGDGDELLAQIKEYLDQLMKRKVPEKEEEEVVSAPSEDSEKLQMPGKYYKSIVHFQPDSKMENIRAFGIVNSLQDRVLGIAHIPEDILGVNADEEIVANGFVIYMKSDEPADELSKIISDALFVDKFEFGELSEGSPEIPEALKARAVEEENDVADEKLPEVPSANAAVAATPVGGDFIKQNFISVNVNKLDKLMDLVGEIVTTESMVVKNPDLADLQLDNFEKAARQLSKLTSELQDIVNSIRMVPVSTTFHKMKRIVRDMSKKINKEADLVLIGEETEVDKNIIDNLGDPLMHLIRNAMDHGLETPDEREAAGKPRAGKVTLEARNTGSDVMIIVHDDGRGLDREKLIQKAQNNGLTMKDSSEISDKEAYSFILQPGFSTKEAVTEFSGRGVGMDVVQHNIEKLGGKVHVESTFGEGMSAVIRIPLTLAIIDGMTITLGGDTYIVPILSIRESFKPRNEDLVIDPDGHEMIMIRGECYPILRLHRIFNVNTEITEFEEGILLTVESESGVFCIFADELVGELQAVVKPIPDFIEKSFGKVQGLAGCTVLGNGSISLILDVNELALFN